MSSLPTAPGLLSAWEELEEDEFGRLKAVDPTLAQRAKRQRLLDQASGARIRRGMIRYCLLCDDLSAAVNEARVCVSLR